MDQLSMSLDEIYEKQTTTAPQIIQPPPPQPPQQQPQQQQPPPQQQQAVGVAQSSVPSTAPLPNESVVGENSAGPPPRRNNNNNRRGRRTRRGKRNGGHSKKSSSSPTSASNRSGERTLKISSESEVRQVAGAIAHITREEHSPSLLAIGAGSINQAVKAIAIARGYLEEDKLDLLVHAEERPDKRNGLAFTLTKGPRREPNASDEDADCLKVSKGSSPFSVAGAIANKLRESHRVALLAIGADSVATSAKSVAISRRYLRDDGIDVGFRPLFTKVKFDDGRDCSAIRIVLLSQQI